MHELAHVRRWDNLTMLLHRLVAAVLFFHPAMWLCGRMLRREAEQACDDFVVCATGRSEAYARGLAHIAERAVHLNPLIRRIPTMNAFAAGIGFSAENPQDAWRQCAPDGHAGARVGGRYCYAP